MAEGSALKNEGSAPNLKLFDVSLRRNDIIKLVKCVAEGRPTDFSGVTDPTEVLARAGGKDIAKREYALNLLCHELHSWSRSVDVPNMGTDPTAQRIILAIAKMNPSRDEMEEAFPDRSFRAKVETELQKHSVYREAQTTEQSILQSLRKGETMVVDSGGFMTLKRGQKKPSAVH